MIEAYGTTLAFYDMHTKTTLTFSPDRESIMKTASSTTTGFNDYRYRNLPLKNRGMNSIHHTAILLLLLYLMLFSSSAFSMKDSHFDINSDKKQLHTSDLKRFVGSSLYLLGNFMSGVPVYDLYLTYNFRIRQNVYLMIEGMT